jgi:hypothetical protein
MQVAFRRVSVSSRRRYLSGYGLIEAPLEVCVERLVGAEIGERGVLSVARPGEPAADPLHASLDEAVGYLSHLTHPATRRVLFAVSARWSAVVDNARDGSDFADDQRWFSQRCGARSCRVVDVEGATRQVRGYVVRDGYPARIFELADEEGRTVRSVRCALDGDRWDFRVSGPELPAEAGFDYTARRKRDRFTSGNLQTLLASLGVDPPVPAAFDAADRFVLLAERLKDRQWASEVEARACTPDQAEDPGYAYLQRGRGWVPHMKTHATSVVWDMERARLLSPGLAGDVQPYLDAARKQLGKAEFARLSGEVAAHLRERGA